MKRPKTAILLILAFLATFFAPIQASWACPDGTPCVADRGHGYVCASDQCGGMASCCETEHGKRCQHGAIPSLERKGSADPSIQAPDHCQFELSSKQSAKALTASAGTFVGFAFDALPAPLAVELTAPIITPTWLAEYTLGYRPPPSSSTGPSRAPPVA